MTALVAALCALASSAFALGFPALSGRVVDQAGVMSAASKSDVEAKSKALEEKSGVQLAVVTVASLQGSDIESYANQLFRFWKLGEAQKNNGVLLFVAPVEHKVRIEVGYGLEGTETDALSSVIIASAIIPRFKSGDFSGGIER
ncbi:MAG: TPM domain-containing protein, partial [Xanthobacteraceae bacterium]